MEEKILLFIQNNLRADWLSPIVKFITYLGNAGIIWIILSLLFLVIPKMRKHGLMTSLALIYDLLFVNVIAKNLFKRVRPYEVIEGLSIIIEKQSDFSFPSGHTAASFAFATVAFIVLPKKYSVPIGVLAVLISLSRLYVGVHYPTDILGGALIGALCGILAFLTLKNKKILQSK